MSKPTIKKPKIFISYAWGLQEFQAKVVAFATDLCNDGIEVILDKWSLKEGHDTYAFMEQCVIDPGITNVLILLDEQYKNKADSRSGGVGVETQIISPEIYNKVKQEKFIPVVFERGIDGEVYKPSYLKNLLHFDLSQSEQYDVEYRRLVKRLHGIEVLDKPVIGERPSWVDATPTISTKTRSAYSFFKTNKPDDVNTENFLTYLSQIKERITGFQKDTGLKDISCEQYIPIYHETNIIRDEFLHLLHYVNYISEGEQYIANFLEEVWNDAKSERGLLEEFKLILIHEIFIYIIAFYYKNQAYDKLAYTLGKTYFKNNKYEVDHASNYNIFYSKNDKFDNAMYQRDEKKYYSGKAQYWIENINIETCSKNDFIFADLLCYNYAIFGKDYHYSWYWFPITYIYSGHENEMLRSFATKLQSMEWLSKAKHLFGYEDEEEFKEVMIKVEKLHINRDFKEYRYGSSFDSATTLCDYIKAKDLGVYR